MSYVLERLSRGSKEAVAVGSTVTVSELWAGGSVAASALATSLATTWAIAGAAAVLPAHPLLGAELRAFVAGGVAFPQALVQAKLVSIGIAVVCAVLQPHPKLVHHPVAVRNTVGTGAVHQAIAKTIHVAVAIASLSGGGHGRGQGKAGSENRHACPAGETKLGHLSECSLGFGAEAAASDGPEGESDGSAMDLFIKFF